MGRGLRLKGTLNNYMNKLINNKIFIFIACFCITYTFFDVTESIVTLFNHTGGGIQLERFVQHSLPSDITLKVEMVPPTITPTVTK